MVHTYLRSLSCELSGFRRLLRLDILELGWEDGGEFLVWVAGEVDKAIVCNDDGIVGPTFCTHDGQDCQIITRRSDVRFWSPLYSPRSA